MKKVDRLVLRSFIGPLILTFLIAVFVLLMQFVWKYVDDMIGKGLEFKVVVELLFYASATFVPMALPIAVLFASIMTMGGFGEKYELIALKAGGISLTRVMAPMAVVVVLLTGVAFAFANNVMPVANLKYRTVLYDVTRKKPAINIRPGEFYSEIDGYVIHINDKRSDGMTLSGITIYDQSHGPNDVNVVVARSGRMQTSPDERYLVFTLHDGCMYSEPTGGDNYQRKPFTRIDFRQQQIAFDISSFAFNKSDDDFFKNNYRMMNLSQLQTQITALNEGLARREQEYDHQVWGSFPAMAEAHKAVAAGAADTLRYEGRHSLATLLSVPQRRTVVAQAYNEARLMQERVSMHRQILQSDNEYINRHHIEYQRKFTLSVACFILFLVGAPFGSIVRRGGLGLPLVSSVFFFVMYYVIGMIAEKSVRTGVMGPWGMWVSSLVMLPIGIVLTLYATGDSNLRLTQWVQHHMDALRQRRQRRVQQKS